MKKTLITALFVQFFCTNVYAKQCADFPTHEEAQKYYEENKGHARNLDRDGDGSACDCLKADAPKACSSKKSKKQDKN